MASHLTILVLALLGVVSAVKRMPCREFVNKVGIATFKGARGTAGLYRPKEYAFSYKSTKNGGPSTNEQGKCSNKKAKNCGWMEKLIDWEACLYDTGRKQIVSGTKCEPYKCCSSASKVAANLYGFAIEWPEWERTKLACTK